MSACTCMCTAAVVTFPCRLLQLLNCRLRLKRVSTRSGLTGEGGPCDEAPHLSPAQAQVHEGVEAAGRGEHHAIGVLPVQHQLRRHQVHLQDNFISLQHLSKLVCI